jgi:pyruvate/2-oxoglutarate dehydrogenase complex dihydrolipoamide acyltransferase (E2) component
VGVATVGRTGRWHATNFGCYGVTSAAAHGGGHPIGPGPFVVSYGTVGSDHTIGVVLRWDHRITDAAPIARAMTRLEQVLNGEIAAELRPLRQTEPKPVRAVAK